MTGLGIPHFLLGCWSAMDCLVPAWGGAPRATKAAQAVDILGEGRNESPDVALSHHSILGVVAAESSDTTGAISGNSPLHGALRATDAPAQGARS